MLTTRVLGFKADRSWTADLKGTRIQCFPLQTAALLWTCTHVGHQNGDCCCLDIKLNSGLSAMLRYAVLRLDMDAERYKKPTH